MKRLGEALRTDPRREGSVACHRTTEQFPLESAPVALRPGGPGRDVLRPGLVRGHGPPPFHRHLRSRQLHGPEQSWPRCGPSRQVLPPCNAPSLMSKIFHQREGRCVHGTLLCHFPGVDPQNVPEPLLIGELHAQLNLQPPRTDQGGIEKFGTVGHPHHQDVVGLPHLIHFGQELVHDRVAHSRVVRSRSSPCGARGGASICGRAALTWCRFF
mmetsp:Transcript_42451/g.99667  ORF Transcript_42451/g.99667 Transcript_42451/m.99667 type:complete len:213 (+) Transcript_42451:916-1554(+)